MPDGCLCVFDVNLRQRFYSRDVIRRGLQAADVVKLNDEELPVIARLLKVPGNNQEAWMAVLVREYANRVAAYVCGQAGVTPRLPDDFAALFRP